MRRRAFIAALAGAAAAPLAARAQTADRVRRIGVLMSISADEPQTQSLAAFREALQGLGWVEGRTARFDVRWGENDPEQDRRYAAELLALEPDVIVASGTLGVTAVQRATRSVPIVFVQVSDPLGAGVVEAVARPGGNTTGFMNFEYSLSGKWLELLREIAPRVKRAAVLRDAANPAGAAQFGAIQATARSLSVEVSPIDIHDAGAIERAVADFARTADGGLVVTGSAGRSVHHELIIKLAARYRLPAVYSYRNVVTGGGLISYGPDAVEQYRGAAAYVDRILKGEKPGELPVQAPTKFELAINLKTAQALGITVPPALLARADEVIE
jgi:putative ABC transport system substrate-binding protein